MTTTRRDFLKATAAATATGALMSNVHAAGSDTIKVGVVGCGGRGSGAAHDALHAAPNVQVVACGDVFKDRVDGFRNRLARFAKSDEKVKQLNNSVDLPEDRCFVGLDAYQKVIDSGANYIILATPPGFRSNHIAAVVAAGKNLFTEKPVAVDGPGIRKVLNAYEESKKKGLHIAAGTQRRHQKAYLETMKRIHDGAIGDLVGGRCFWNQAILWKRERQPGWSDVAYQCHNWYGYTWTCGDHIVEQHVHNLDVLNWAFNSHPTSAVGMGYRVPRDEGYGTIFNFFAIDYGWGKGVHTLSMCRQISNCANEVGEYLVGTKGFCKVHAYEINGDRLFTREELDTHTNPYVQEHTDLIESIRAGKPLNELKSVTESTLTAILGRMSAYTGRPVSWEQALNSKEDLMPANLAWDMSLPVAPVAEPGRTRLV